MITKLKNPKSRFYEEIKSIILSSDFSWRYFSSTTHGLDSISFFSHDFLQRPEDLNNKYPRPNSNYCDFVCQVLLEILEYNQITINTFFRINANLVEPKKQIENTCEHVDHSFNHSNILVYLTGSGGKTIVGDSEYDPKEDDVIMFDGHIKHYHQTPIDERRVVIVSTFLQ